MQCILFEVSHEDSMLYLLCNKPRIKHTCTLKMNIITPILSPRVQNYGNADHFPTITGPRVFSPLRSIPNQSRDLSTSSFNRTKSHIKFGLGASRQQFYKRWRIVKETNLLMHKNKIENLFKNDKAQGFKTSRNDAKSHTAIGWNKGNKLNTYNESVGNISRWKGRDSKFTENLMAPMASPILKKLDRIDKNSQSQTQMMFKEKQIMLTKSKDKLFKDKEVFTAIMELK